MSLVDNLRAQNHEINELCQVLEVLIKNQSVCGTHVCRELFERFISTVKHHLDTEDRAVYSDLLNHSERSVNEAAERYLSSTREIKRLLTGYLKRWCEGSPSPDKQAGFVSETEEIFKLVRERVRAEEEELLPLVERLQGA